jgi:hypothetical protein
MNTLEPLLTAQDVMRRYSLRDPRAARRIIENAGGHKIAGRWMIRGEILGAWETDGDVLIRISSDPDREIPHRNSAITPPSRSRINSRNPDPLPADWLTDDRYAC